MPQWFSLSHRTLLAGVLALAACGGGGGFLGMGGPATPELCLELRASKQLNLFDDQPHALVVYFYPVSNTTGFEATSVRDLMRGQKADGLAGESWRTTMLPGQTLKLGGEKLPPTATHLAIVADYYAGPSRVIVPTVCDDEQVVTLSASELATAAADGEEKSHE